MTEQQLKNAIKLVRNVCQGKLKITNGKYYLPTNNQLIDFSK